MASQRTFRVGMTVLVLAALAGIGYALCWRKNPSPCPYSQRRWVDIPRPVITRARLRELLAPLPGERVLEIGPGTGYYTNDIAASLEPNGVLHIVDIQHEMVDHVREKVRENDQDIEAVRGDGQALPYSDDSFDAAYLVLVLGEIPDQKRALGELNRVLKPTGRLVIGELLPDPHFVPRGALKRRAERQGFQYDTHVGTQVGYFARFSVPGQSTIEAS